MTQQQSAMRISGGVLVATGVLFALAALPFLHPVAHIFLQIAYWPIHAVPAELTVPLPLLLVITGGLTVGLGGMHWALGTYVAPVSAVAATKTAQITAWSWFCADSLGSILVAAPFNVVLNLSFLVLILVSCRPGTASKHTTS
ncbi:MULTISPECIES: hypothetical protein [unclassified Ruegeria]|uniref:hypothetical protein n=1 Tax=unclassified Ruegeria TaxID=2625375 RepID=UPI001488103F|nr:MULTISPECIES: hypothetical protein [unclassified Ruegeria]